MPPRADIAGQKFNRLTAVKPDHIDKHGNIVWEFKCECGKTTYATVAQVRGGKTKSCGCLKDERAHSFNRKHGGSSERLYGVWANMNGRCKNSNKSDYKFYGARGIKVCNEWQKDYSAFREWAHSNGYDEKAPKGKCTLDRIDNSKGYEPSNCRFVDMSTQSKNQRHPPRKRDALGRFSSNNTKAR